MRWYRTISVSLLAVTLFAAVSNAAPINIVNDWSFEQEPGVPVNGWNGYGPSYSYCCTSTFGAWTVASGSIDLINAFWQAADGVQSVDMNGRDAGSIYQDLTTQPGQQCKLSFSLAGTPGYDYINLQVSWDGNEVAFLNFDAADTSYADMGWETHTFSVTSTGSTTRLQFTSFSPSQSGPVLDAIRVVAAPVPEPSTLPLLGSGLAGLGGMTWRRHRRA